MSEKQTTAEAVLSELRDIRRGIEKMNEAFNGNSPQEETDANEEAGEYRCDECGEVFDKLWELGGHSRNCGADPTRWERSGNERAEEILRVVENSPVDEPTAAMVTPFVGFGDSSPYLSKLHDAGALIRIGSGGKNDPYKYRLTDEAEEWLAERESDE